MHASFLGYLHAFIRNAAYLGAHLIYKYLASLPFYSFLLFDLCKGRVMFLGLIHSLANYFLKLKSSHLVKNLQQIRVHLLCLATTETAIRIGLLIGKILN